MKSEKSRPSAFVVATFDEGTSNIAWFGIDLSKDLTHGNKWSYVTAEFDYPPNLYPEVSFSSFLWNTSPNAIWIDDMKVEFLK